MASLISPVTSCSFFKPSGVVVEQREGRGSVRGVEGVEGLEDGGLACLVLSDQAGHVVDVDLGRLEHVAKRLDVEEIKRKSRPLLLESERRARL
jgi:hypothetical protein